MERKRGRWRSRQHLWFNNWSLKDKKHKYWWTLESLYSRGPFRGVNGGHEHIYAALLILSHLSSQSMYFIVNLRGSDIYITESFYPPFQSSVLYACMCTRACAYTHTNTIWPSQMEVFNHTAAQKLSTHNVTRGWINLLTVWFNSGMGWETALTWTRKRSQSIVTSVAK